MEDGFTTALGTPRKPDGGVLRESFAQHIEDQISAGAVGLLAMGTMGIQSYLTAAEYSEAANIAGTTVRGRIPLLIGVMDNSCSRVAERVRTVQGFGADGVVATTPFYHKLTQEEIVDFYRQVAKESALPVYMYDLPAVTKTPINPETAIALMSEPNIAGLKSGSLLTCKQVYFSSGARSDFAVMYSGLDTFDIAFAYGIGRHLDGMFSCTPNIASQMYRQLRMGDMDGGRESLSRITSLRNFLAELGIFRGFTYVMNRLGYAGTFHPDYMRNLTDTEGEALDDFIERL